MNRITKTIVAPLCFVALFAMLAEACPTCKDGLAGDPARANVARGYAWSILFMMSMPFSILSGIGCYFYLQYKKMKQ